MCTTLCYTHHSLFDFFNDSSINESMFEQECNHEGAYLARSIDYIAGNTISQLFSLSTSYSLPRCSERLLDLV